MGRKKKKKKGLEASNASEEGSADYRFSNHLEEKRQIDGKLHTFDQNLSYLYQQYQRFCLLKARKVESFEHNYLLYLKWIHHNNQYYDHDRLTGKLFSPLRVIYKADAQHQFFKSFNPYNFY